MTRPEDERSLQKRPDLIPDQLLRGGLIEGQIGEPQQSMDRMILGHLDRVALLAARGDTARERAMYIFNPDSRLLINYTSRRHFNPAFSGLFADIVELDEEGNPRHGVSVINPFQTSTGFVEVSVGQNQHGFTPSHVDIKVDNVDPQSIVPPNIETAELLSMLNQDPISENESLEDFLKRTDVRREAIKRNIPDSQLTEPTWDFTTQALRSITNPNLQLIIADRDVESLVQASKEVGLYPIHITTDQLIALYTNNYEGLHRNENPDFSFADFNLWSRAGIFPEMATQKADEPGVITYDPFIIPGTPNLIQPDYRKVSGIRSVFLKDIFDELFVGMGGVNNFRTGKKPSFSILENVEVLEENEDSPPIEKRRPGYYQQYLQPSSPQSVKDYTDWLRKVKLDMALAFYLRGLSKI